MQPAQQDQQFEKELVAAVAEFYYDPYGYALFNWDWDSPPLNKYGGLDDWQIEHLETLGEECLKRDRGDEDVISRAVRIAVGSGHGIGKSQPVDTVIPTPSLPMRMGNLRPGDKVFGVNGAPITVQSVHPQGYLQTYRVTFDDGSSTVCSGEHLWTVHERRGRERTLTTEQMIAEGVSRKNGSGRARRWHVPRIKPVEYFERWVPVEPYALGAWIGDGTASKCEITTADFEIISRIVASGYTAKERRLTNCGQASTWSIRELGQGLRMLSTVRIGVDEDKPLFNRRAHEKSIPVEYLFNSIRTRTRLLQGLMDTDGYVSEWGAASYCTVSRQLAEDVAHLVRSLGGKARINGGKPKSYTNASGEKVTGSPAYSVGITMPDGFPLFHIERKSSRHRPSSQKRYLERYIDSIKPEGSQECVCIKVDAEDSLYLTNEFIPTHNTMLTSIIIHWFVATRVNPQAIITANTKDQLTNKTWRELGKMNGYALNGHWFEHTATKFIMKSRPKTWYATAVPWSEGNSEAFAGTHEASVLMLFDEASAVADIIWEVAEGAMTTPGAIFLAFGNRTRNTGTFSDCWKRKRDRWITFEVDARQSRVADQKQIQEWIDDYGIDSDFVKVRVLGKEPFASAKQLIPANFVDRAIERSIDIKHVPPQIPRLMGADCAAGGEGKSVIVRRQGPKMFSEINRWNVADPLVLGGYFAEQIKTWNPDIFFIDAHGVGLGTYYYLLNLGFQNVVPVYWGDRSLVVDKQVYYNPRIECWARCREWLRTADIPDDRDLKQDLIGPEYSYDMNFCMRLEKKEDMAKRGLPSPDTGDALAVTFFHAVPVKMDHLGSEDLDPEIP